MSNDTEDLLRRSMSAYAGAVDVGIPDLGRAGRTVIRRRRVRTGLAAGLAVSLLAAAVVGVAAVGGQRPRATSAAPLPVAAGSPLPGLVRLVSVRVPDDVRILAQSTGDGQVWAVGADPADHIPLLLHAADGGTLVAVAEFPGAVVQVALRDGRALVVVQTNDAGTPWATQQTPMLRVYDATTGALRSSRALAPPQVPQLAGAGLIAAADGTLLLAVRTRPVIDGSRATVRFSALAPDGSLSATTRPIAVSRDDDDLNIGQPSLDGNGVLTAVTTSAGRPRYAYATVGFESVERYDLDTGTITEITTNSTDSFPNGSPFTAAAGVVGGRMLFTSYQGLRAGPVGATATPPLVGRFRSVTVVGGIAYAPEVGPAGQTYRRLDDVTLQPSGPAGPASGPLFADVNGDGVGVLVGAHPVGAVTTGGELVAYGPTGG